MKKIFFIIFLLIVPFIVEAQKKWLPGLTGYINTNKNQEAVSSTIPKTRGVTSIPIRYSLREFTPTVREQEGGTCVGWATTYAGMSILENIKLGRKDKIAKDSNAFSPYFTYTIGKSSYDDDCEDGMLIEKALNTLQNVGAIKNLEFNKICLNTKNSVGIERVITDTTDKKGINDLVLKLKENRLQNYIPIAGNNIVENIKYFLSKKMPVIIGSEMYSSITENLISNVWNGVKDDYPGGHAMCVVGYDDTKFGGAFEIMNSWGDDYGDNGFIWFRYLDFANVVDVAYALTGIENKKSVDTDISDFNITLSAVGSKTSRILPISSTINYDFSRRSVLNSLTDKYEILYSDDDEGYRVNFTSNSDKSFYIYAFSLSQEHINFETSLIENDEILNKRGGIILPTNPYSTFLFPKDEYCILISKVKFETDFLINSIKNSYSSITEYLHQNFNSLLVINQPIIDNTFDDKIKILVKHEPNEVLPILITHNLDKNRYNIFKSSKLNIRDYSLEDQFEQILAKFKNSKKSSNQIDLSANFKVQKNGNIYTVLFSCSKTETLDDLLNIFDQDATSYKKSNPYLFQTSFTGTLDSIEKTLQNLIFNNLNKAKIDFVFTND